MPKRTATKTAPKQSKASTKAPASIREQVAAAHEAARVARRKGEPHQHLVERAHELERLEASARG